MPPTDHRPHDGSPERVLLDATPGPLHPAARETLLAALDAGWADPRRRHREGRTARRLLDTAREVLAGGLGVRPPELSLLPGGPPALTAGLEGLRHARRRSGTRVVLSAVEHSALLAPARAHAAAAGDPDLVAEVPVDRAGRVDLAAWAAAVAHPGTAAAALQAANQEVGTRQPLAPARAAGASYGVPLLVDATACLGRDAPPPAGAYDVLVGDARSWGGPTGVGLLVVPERTRWRRPGPPTDVEHGRTDVEPSLPLVLAAAEAWRQAEHDRAAEAAAAAALVDRIRAAAAAVPDVEVVGDPVDRLPHVVTFSALLVDGEVLVDELDRAGVAVASGSACTASTLEPSHVLVAMGVLTHGNVRVTLPLAATLPGGDAERERGVDAFCALLPRVVDAVRERLGTRSL
ncbi:aminotransferase class V-fold PLP-dependent enzyme [Lapillicoccus jejuensis]|uniref:aminotransferase class V-fold PLP-dependent enzyme n=1 Tax=Lapillicoccus jejuensis TaxID=402171 RepID=UPI001150C6E2|nr:aminotransferase class V-fold PLP-dependent enzyme [Lapillicoccus jejuensis]